MILTFLENLQDHRRKQGQRYKLKHIVLFSIMAMLSNAKSYRDIERYIRTHYEKLDCHFELGWKRPPAYTTVRDIIRGICAKELETCFRKYSSSLDREKTEGLVSVAVDGKVLRKSFDKFNDREAIAILSFFETGSDIILAHEVVSSKTNEIPVAQSLITALDLGDVVYTFDALHCQKALFELAESEDGQEKKTSCSSEG